MILKDDDLERLTGYRKPSKQIEWLRSKHIPHLVNAAGRPVVLDTLLPIKHLTGPKLGEVR